MNICTSIDIGSDTIKFVVAEASGNRVNVLASTTIKSKGIRKGLIVDANLAVNAIKDGLKIINEDLGITIKNALVTIPDYNIKFMYVTGKINVDGVVTPDNINAVIKDSIYNKLAENYELVTVIPLAYALDEKDVEGVPIDMPCATLGIKGIMLSVPKKNIYSVLSVMNGAGIKVTDITISGLADYYQVRNHSLDELVGAVINIGHETTHVSIINRGIIMNTETMQMGGALVENDIAYVFNTNVIDARKIKEKFATAHKRFTSLNESYELKNNLGNVLNLNQMEVSEVVQSRLVEILNLAKKQINILTKRKINYIVITGGVSETRAFKNLVYEILGKDVIIYMMDEIGIRDNKYITAMGIIKGYIDKMTSRGKLTYSLVDKEDMDALVTPDNKIKKDKMVVSKLFKNLTKFKEENHE